MVSINKDIISTFSEDSGSFKITSNVKLDAGVMTRVAPDEPIRFVADDGIIFPSRTETQRDDIADPQDGAAIYNSTEDNMNFFYKGRWNSLAHQTLLIASSFNNQEPSAVDIALQIEFGAAQGSGSDPVSLAADGTITINEDGFYTTTFGVQYGRTNTNLTAIIHFRILLNGSQIGSTATAIMPTDASDRPLSVTVGATFEAGDEITAEVIRDSNGVNDGGLLTVSVTAAGWADSPSASIRISR